MSELEVSHARERAAEDVDVANMAFLDWYTNRRLERDQTKGDRQENPGP